MKTLRTALNRKWWWKTLIILAGMAFLSSLGIWQLNRLEERRLYNETLIARLEAEPVNIDSTQLPASLDLLEDRRALATGQYDYEHQISVKNQYLEGQLGVALVTPLLLEGEEVALLVNRGWVPHQVAEPALWAEYEEGGGGTLSGYIQLSQTLPDGTQSAIPEDLETGWFRIDLGAIEEVLPYRVLPIVLQLAPDPGERGDALPRRFEPDLTVGEGNHLSYAIQWFIFALIGGVVYLSIVRREEGIGQTDGSSERPVPPLPSEHRPAKSI